MINRASSQIKIDRAISINNAIAFIQSSMIDSNIDAIMIREIDDESLREFAYDFEFDIRDYRAIIESMHSFAISMNNQIAYRI